MCHHFMQLLGSNEKSTRVMDPFTIPWPCSALVRNGGVFLRLLLQGGSRHSQKRNSQGLGDAQRVV